MPDIPRRMLLIHGAWHGAWTFDTWRPQLLRRGWKSHAINLPGNGCDPRDATAPGAVSLQLYVSHALAALLRMDETPVVVVGHGIGGIVASQLAEAAPHLVSRLVYIAGMMLPTDTTYAEVVEQCRVAQPEIDFGGIASHLEPSVDGRSSTLSARVARELLVHDLHEAAPEFAEAVVAQMKAQPESGRNAVNLLSADRFGRVPRLYVEALQDRAVRLPVQRLMQQLTPGAQIISMDCGHMPQLVQPRLLADLVCDALEASPTEG